MRKVPIISAVQAAELVKDYDIIGFCGAGGGIVEPTELINALAERYRTQGCPRNITLLHATGLGDRAERGLSPLAQPGLVKRAIGGHWDQSPRLAQMAARNEIEAYNLPMGVLSQMYRAAAAHQPGILTKIGLHTYIDPRQCGGKLNDATTEDLVELENRQGEEYLFYRTVRPNVVMLRATTADELGYLSMEDEIAFLDVLEMAMAAHNNGGTVIVQVSRVVPAGGIPPKQVKVPGYLVDALVVAEMQPQLYDAPVSPYFSGTKTADESVIVVVPLSERKVIARRALQEAACGDVANVGVGMADGVGLVAHEEGIGSELTLTVETGPIGGISAQGYYFGASYNNRAVIPMPSQFDFYDGGGLDIAFVSFAEIDAAGNVNVSRFGDKIVGTGGFVEISQTGRKAVFCGTLTSGGLQIEVGDGKLRIVREGLHRKFPRRVREITYSGGFAVREGREAVYVTERAVFRLTAEGVMLCEYAPGIDVERDILAQMDFKPLIAPDLHLMDSRLFRAEKVGIILTERGR